MKILCMGDSTMQFNNIYKYPQTGWPQMLPLFFGQSIEIVNFGKNGRSTKSFIEQGRFAKLLECLEAGDYVICEFGHNDAKESDPLRYTRPFEEYQTNLDYFAKEVIKKGGHIVFATPICRHKFIDGVCVPTHGDYPKAMLELCQKNNYEIVDLEKLTRDLYNKLGEKETEKFHMIFAPNTYENYPEGKEDHTHLKPAGALMVAKLFAKGLRDNNISLAKYLLTKEEVDPFDIFMLKD